MIRRMGREGFKGGVGIASDGRLHPHLDQINDAIPPQKKKRFKYTWGEGYIEGGG